MALLIEVLLSRLNLAPMLYCPPVQRSERLLKGSTKYCQGIFNRHW